MRKLVAYLFVLKLLFVLVACIPVSPPKGSGTSAPPQGDTVQVLFVIDGDTIEVESQGQSYRVRYIGVDTPERDEPFYEEAAQANRDLVDGKEIVLVRDVSETDKYGRLLRYIYLPDGTFVNAELIGQGFGRVITFPPDVTKIALLTNLQREARENQRGLWGLSEMQSLPAECNTCGKNSHDCRDFSSQAAAQACFDFCKEKTGRDVHNLDGGDDGVVCESLP